MLLGNVKTAKCLIFVALHEKLVSMPRFEITGIEGEKGLERVPELDSESEQMGHAHDGFT